MGEPGRGVRWASDEEQGAGRATDRERGVGQITVGESEAGVGPTTDSEALGSVEGRSWAAKTGAGHRRGTGAEAVSTSPSCDL